jgi:hypothetical protein
MQTNRYDRRIYFFICWMHGCQPTASQPAGQTAQLTGLCVQFSSLSAGSTGLCLLLSPDSES